MELVIAIFYLLLCSVLLLYIPFLKRAGLKGWLPAIFFIKVAAGFAYAGFYKLPKNYPEADTWRFYKQSLQETKLLLTSPSAFVTDLFSHGYAGSGSLFLGTNSYWNDLKSNLFVKLIALMNVITNSSYYTNIILFNFLFLFGLVGIFRIYQSIYPGRKKLLMASVFCMPSTLFWCSGIHKDGLILSALGITIYLLFTWCGKNRIAVSRAILVLLCMAMIFFLRNYILLALLPALFCWWLNERYAYRNVTLFFFVYAIGLTIFFILPIITPALNLPAYFSAKQQEFLSLEGGSLVTLHPLEPTFAGFLKFLPSAAELALFRPFITEVRSVSYVPAVIEVYLISILFLLGLLFPEKGQSNSFVFFAFFFSASVLFICGYTIPFTGAIVRYRCIVYPLMIPPLACMIKWPSGRRLNIQKNNISPHNYI